MSGAESQGLGRVVRLLLQLHQLGKGIGNMAWALGGQVGGPVTDNVQGLADEVAAWMGVGNVVIKGGRALPADLVE